MGLPLPSPGIRQHQPEIVRKARRTEAGGVGGCSFYREYLKAKQGNHLTMAEVVALSGKDSLAFVMACS